MKLAILALLLIVGCTPTPTSQPTIGALNPAVTQATIGSTICVAGWTASIRPPVAYTSALKRRQMLEFHLPGSPSDYEEDHLMPLGLGGAPQAEANLRPVPLAEALQDDTSERELQREVCAGRITLADAQAQISYIKRDLR